MNSISKKAKVVQGQYLSRTCRTVLAVGVDVLWL